MISDRLEFDCKGLELFLYAYISSNPCIFPGISLVLSELQYYTKLYMCTLTYLFYLQMHKNPLEWSILFTKFIVFHSARILIIMRGIL